MSTQKNGITNAGAGLTMEDIAKVAGVSKITVSRALRDSPLVKPDTREKIRKLASEHGYRFNVSARNLRMRRSYSVAVVVEMTPMSGRPMSDPYPLALLGGITQQLTTAGYSVILTAKQLIDTGPVQGADGVILLGQGLHGDAMHAMERSGLPLVVWGAQEEGSTCVVVGSDNHKSGLSVAERFIGLGRKKIIFLGDVDHAEVGQRCAGLIKGMHGHGKVHIIRPKAFTVDSGFASIAAALKKTPHACDGVFAASDLLAMGAIRALAENNLQVPEDVSVVGYDDSPSAASFIPALTSVHQDLRDGGEMLAQKILDLIDGKVVSSEMLPTKLVVRQT